MISEIKRHFIDDLCLPVLQAGRCSAVVTKEVHYKHVLSYIDHLQHKQH